MDPLKTHRRAVLLGAAALSLAAGGARAADRPVAETAHGRIRGKHVAGGVAEFKGVPYARAERFMPPTPPRPWTGVLDTVAYGLTAPQGPIARYPVLESWDGDFDSAPQGEDCQVLNLWTPKLDNGKRPVMLYLHGGGFTGRSGARPVFDGAEMARLYDVIVITINHRINAFGYIYLGHLDPRLADSGNSGTLDTLQSLKWVRENIARFGGDPGNVTIFGQSGGGGKVNALLGAPAAKGYFHKAIVQSGSFLKGRPSADAARVADSFMKSMGLGPGDIDRLRTMPWRDIVAGLQRAKGTDYSDRNYEPVVDGRTLPDGPWFPNAPAVSAHVPLMIGGTRTETTMLFGSTDPKVFDIDEAELRKRATPYVEGIDVDQVIADFRRTRPGATPADIYFAITTAVRFRKPATFEAEQRLGQQGGAPVYMYEVAWKTPVDGGKWQSPHSMEHGLVFHNLSGNETMYGTTRNDEVAKVADQMSPAWAAFARTGDPNHPAIPQWAAYDLASRPTMVFDVESKVERNLRAGDLAALAKLPAVPEGGDLLTRSLR